MKIAARLVILFFTLFSYLNGQTGEVRGVWVATNYRLDWGGSNTEELAGSLKQIMSVIKERGFTDVYFQVRSNGTLLFESNIEPYSSDIAPQNVNYDWPAFAVSEARKNGLKIHAWMNTVRCFSGTNYNARSDKNHVMNKHPEWIVGHRENDNISYWLDPGLPGVKEYLASVAGEIVTKYDFDGLQLDFLRYPGKNFADYKSYKNSGTNLSRDDWRRENVTTILEAVSEKVKNVNPEILIGVTPIGIHKNSGSFFGLEGYGDVYQDAGKWAETGLADYLAPQLYWSVNGQPGFLNTLLTWKKSTGDAKLIVGLGLYKENLRPEARQMIELARANGAAGFAVYRYANLLKTDLRFEKVIDEPEVEPSPVPVQQPELPEPYVKASDSAFTLVVYSNIIDTLNFTGIKMSNEELAESRPVVPGENEITFYMPIKSFRRITINLQAQNYNRSMTVREK